MAGQEIEGDLWDQLALLPQTPSAHVGFRILSPTSVKKLGSRDPRLKKLALDPASRSCRSTYVSKRNFYARSD